MIWSNCKISIKNSSISQTHISRSAEVVQLHQARGGQDSGSLPIREHIIRGYFQRVLLEMVGVDWWRGKVGESITTQIHWPFTPKATHNLKESFIPSPPQINKWLLSAARTCLQVRFQERFNIGMSKSLYLPPFSWLPNDHAAFEK